MLVSKPLDYKIHVATDYNLLKHFAGNRPVSKNLVSRLKKSMSEKQLPVPIIVNEKLEIIDGQHRFEACKQLGLPVYYIIITNVQLKDVHTLNTVGAKWTITQYLEAYCSMGKEEYIYLKQMLLKYKIPLNNLMQIEKSSRNNRNVGAVEINVHLRDVFNNGDFVAENKERFELILNQLNEISAYSHLYSRESFIKAYTRCLNLKTINFSHEEFINKLKNHPKSLVPATTWEDYLVNIEEIYNHGRKIKVRLKYAD